MFSMRRLAPEPTNCPLCLYAPSCFPDLCLHLQVHHPRSPPPSQCPFHCGFYYLHRENQLAHLLTCHFSTANTALWKTMSNQQDVMDKLIALTCRFLLKVKTLERCGRVGDITEEKDFALLALIEHSREVLRLFPHKQRIRLKKRSDSPNSGGSQTRVSTSISPRLSPSS